MSAGPFSLGRYERDNGRIHPVKCQPETTELTVGGEANNFPADNTANKSDISARISGSKRALGLHCRTIRVKFGATQGSAPDGYALGASISLPIFDPTLYNAITKGDTGNYLGKVVTVTSKSPEVAV